MHERKHSKPKKFATQSTKLTDDWESMVLREVTCKHKHEARDEQRFYVQAGLINSYEPNANLASKLAAALGHGDFKVASSARTRKYEKVGLGDVVLYAGSAADMAAGRIALLVEVPERFDGGGKTLLVGLENNLENLATAGEAKGGDAPANPTSSCYTKLWELPSGQPQATL